VAGDRVFCSCGWGTGWGLVRVVRDKDNFRAEEVYFAKGNLDPWLGSSVLVGGEVHTSCGQRIDLATGKLLEDLRLSRGTVVYADGRLYHRKSDGTLLLHEVTAGGYAPRGAFQPPRSGNAPPWSFPVIAGGKLFVRDQGLLLCYEVRAADAGRPPAPGAAFVPMPQEVVEEVRKLAQVTKADTVCDLGCEDCPIRAAGHRPVPPQGRASATRPADPGLQLHVPAQAALQRAAARVAEGVVPHVQAGQVVGPEGGQVRCPDRAAAAGPARPSSTPGHSPAGEVEGGGDRAGPGPAQIFCTVTEAGLTG
jgi:hypothetical protein